MSTGNAVAFLGRNITNRGEHYEISLSDDYITTLLTETICRTASQHQHQAHQHWRQQRQTMTNRFQQRNMLNTDEQSGNSNGWHNISYATKEVARALQQPTAADQQKLKHLLRYIEGAKHYKQIIRPTVKLLAKGCPTTRKSTTGFLIALLGTTMNHGSRTQATTVLSSLCTRAELYAINTGATEALHSRSLPMELLNFSTSTRSTSRSTQTHQVARAWPQALDPQGRQNTSNSNTSSFNNWFHTTTWD